MLVHVYITAVLTPLKISACIIHDICDIPQKLIHSIFYQPTSQKNFVQYFCCHSLKTSRHKSPLYIVKWVTEKVLKSPSGITFCLQKRNEIKQTPKTKEKTMQDNDNNTQIQFELSDGRVVSRYCLCLTMLGLHVAWITTRKLPSSKLSISVLYWIWLSPWESPEIANTVC